MIRPCVFFLALFLLVLNWPGFAAAQDAAEAARLAALDLEDAAIQLDAAEEAADRVVALTETIRAFEGGLAAMRDGLRAASVREIELTRVLNAREAEVAQLLATLQSMGQQTGPASSLHPNGALDTARAGMLVASVTPALARRASELRADLEEVTVLRQLQQDAADRLRAGLSGVQQARTALSQAMSERTDLPKRFTEDPQRTASLIAATETLQGFASGLSEIAEGDITPRDVSIGDRQGLLPLPVAGSILRWFGETDAAGIERPGIVIATQPGALVTTPSAATIRYLGPLLDYGLVAILEPQPDTLFVLAGLATAYGETGSVIPEGSPVGLMGGQTDPDILSQSGERGGTERPETLYIEVRVGETPVDPLEWFTTDKG